MIIWDIVRPLTAALIIAASHVGQSIAYARSDNFVPPWSK
jgi:hypothetical protein